MVELIFKTAIFFNKEIKKEEKRKLDNKDIKKVKEVKEKYPKPTQEQLDGNVPYVEDRPGS